MTPITRSAAGAILAAQKKQELEKEKQREEKQEQEANSHCGH